MVPGSLGHRAMDRLVVVQSSNWTPALHLDGIHQILSGDWIACAEHTGLAKKFVWFLRSVQGTDL